VALIVSTRAGGAAVLTLASEIYAALGRGVLDASERIGPHDDLKLGLQNTARYYYPGWHEPGNTTEFGFNKKAYEALPVDLQRTLDRAAAAVQVYGLTDFHVKNAIALERLKADSRARSRCSSSRRRCCAISRSWRPRSSGRHPRRLPWPGKVHASFTKFQAQLAGWSRASEGAYHEFVAL
jgi:TRAP-type mannitol/chloroaromatic compound transport system substrate-binding protein